MAFGIIGIFIQALERNIDNLSTLSTARYLHHARSLIQCAETPKTTERFCWSLLQTLRGYPGNGILVEIIQGNLSPDLPSS